MIDNKCRMCRKQFESSRPAQTCSPRCRKRYQRLKSDMKANCRMLHSSLLSIQNATDRRADLRGYAIDELKHLKGLIDNLLLRLGDQEAKDRYAFLNDYRTKRDNT
jgi:hypothetical protein